MPFEGNLQLLTNDQVCPEMEFATNQIGQLTEATTLRTGFERRENQYYCPECQQEVYVALSGPGKNYFRHKPGHKICFYSSSSGQKRNKKQDWDEFLENFRYIIYFYLLHQQLHGAFIPYSNEETSDLYPLIEFRSMKSIKSI